ncbi:hypothetical protein PP594_25945 [Mycobacteroides abscessus]|nr:hypothetical protein [Mycobacteroides abscessus]
MSFGRATAAVAAALIASAPPAAADDDRWTSFAGGIAPGTGIAQTAQGEYYACTLGLIAGDPATHRLYGITAGHCDNATMGRTVLYTDANSPDVARPLGTYTASRSDDGPTPTGPDALPLYTDAGVIAIQAGTPIASFKIAGVYPVRGVVEDYHDLPADTEVCKFGMKTGETCGPVVAASTYTVSAKLRADHGDSGSPLYIRNNDGTVNLIGIASASNSDLSRFFYVAPVLKALHLQVCGCGSN